MAKPGGDSHWSRRELIGALGAGIGLGIASRLEAPATLVAGAPAQAPLAPRGTIIRTIVADIEPGTITGATLMHEHLGNGRRPRPAVKPWGSAMQRRNGNYLFAPSDLLAFLGCTHATVLDIAQFDNPVTPRAPTESDDLIADKGHDHETAYLQSLKDAGLTVVEISREWSHDEQVRRTREALRAGVDETLIANA